MLPQPPLRLIHHKFPAPLKLLQLLLKHRNNDSSKKDIHIYTRLPSRTSQPLFTNLKILE